MSLINEALQRAREEAVRQEAAKKGVPLPAVPRLKEKSGWLTFAVLVLAITLAVSVIALLGLARRLPTTVTEPAVMATSGSGSGVTSEPDAELGIEASRPSTESHLKTAAQTADASDDAGDPPPAVANVGPTRHTTDGVDRAELATIEQSPPLPGESGAEGLTGSDIRDSAPGQVDPDPSTESFVRHVDLGEGVSIELGGIAWSESGPFALLNGRVVGIGESVSGLIVREIDPLQVVLEGHSRRLVLRLK